MEKNILTELPRHIFDEVVIFPSQELKLNKRVNIVLPPLHESKRKKMFSGKSGPEKLFDIRKAVYKMCPYKLPVIAHNLASKAADELVVKTISGGKKKPEKKDYHLNISNVPPFDDFDILEITQLDPHFFSCIEGRPIRDVCDRKLYMAHMRNLSLVLQKIALSKDIIVNIDSQYIREVKKYETHLMNLDEIHASYEQFLQNDHNKSIQLLNEGQLLLEQLVLTDLELQSYTKKEGLVSRNMKDLYFKIARMKTYQHFLYQITPNPKIRRLGKQKRSRNKELLEGAVFEKQLERSDEEKYPYIDVKFKDVEVNVDESLSIAEIITFSQNLQNETPTLFFDKPHQILVIFTLMAQLACICLEHESITAEEIQRTQEDLTSIKIALANQLEEKEDTIKWFLHLTEFLESQADDVRGIYIRTLKKTMPLFASKFNLSIMTNIEWLYQLTVGKNETKRSAIELLREMEIVREKYLRVLDKIEICILKVVEKEVYSLEIKSYNTAVKANLEISRLEHCKENLRQTYGPPLKFRRASFGRFRRHSSKPVKSRKHTLTEKELAYIKMFTSWCEGQDPRQFLGGQAEINEILGFDEF